MSLRKLPVNMEELIDALSQSQESEMLWFLDTLTGEVVTVGSEYLSDEDDDDHADALDLDEDDDLADAEDATPAHDEPDWIRQERETARRINEGGDRYREIEPLDSHEAYRFMEAFIDTLDNAKLRDGLTRAIQGRGAFRHFKDALSDHNLLERWAAFEQERYLQCARDWLESVGIEPVA